MPGGNRRGSGSILLRALVGPGGIDVLDGGGVAGLFVDAQDVGSLIGGRAHVDGNGNGRNVDLAECADGEESENGFGEHHDGEGRKRADDNGTRPEVGEVGEGNWGELHSG